MKTEQVKAEIRNTEGQKSELENSKDPQVMASMKRLQTLTHPVATLPLLIERLEYLVSRARYYDEQTESLETFESLLNLARDVYRNNQVNEHWQAL